MVAQLGISKTREGFKIVNDPTKYLKYSFLYFLEIGEGERKPTVFG